MIFFNKIIYEINFCINSTAFKFLFGIPGKYNQQDLCHLLIYQHAIVYHDELENYYA